MATRTAVKGERFNIRSHAERSLDGGRTVYNNHFLRDVDGTVWLVDLADFSHTRCQNFDLSDSTKYVRCFPDGTPRGYVIERWNVNNDAALAEVGGVEPANDHYIVRDGVVTFYDARRGTEKPSGIPVERFRTENSYVRCDYSGKKLKGPSLLDLDKPTCNCGLDTPRFEDAVEPTPAQVAEDRASLREYQRSRGFEIPMGVAEAEGGSIFAGPVYAVVYEDAPVLTQVFEDEGDFIRGRIASLVLGSQTCALDANGNPLPL